MNFDRAFTTISASASALRNAPAAAAAARLPTRETTPQNAISLLVLPLRRTPVPSCSRSRGGDG